MEGVQLFIEDMAGKALSDWTDGTEKPLFPRDETTNENPGSMIWYMTVNAMAYGFERGVEMGYRMAESESEG